MKKNIYILTIITVLFAACSKEELSNNDTTSSNYLLSKMYYTGSEDTIYFRYDDKNRLIEYDDEEGLTLNYGSDNKLSSYTYHYHNIHQERKLIYKDNFIIEMENEVAIDTIFLKNGKPVEDANGKYGYDSDGNMAFMIHPNDTFSYTYNKLYLNPEYNPTLALVFPGWFGEFNSKNVVQVETSSNGGYYASYAVLEELKEYPKYPTRIKVTEGNTTSYINYEYKKK